MPNVVPDSTPIPQRLMVTIETSDFILFDRARRDPEKSYGSVILRISCARTKKSSSLVLFVCRPSHGYLGNAIVGVSNLQEVAVSANTLHASTWESFELRDAVNPVS